jgi:hypothetical protein
MEATLEILEELEDDLSARAFLYDDPATFREGVEAAMTAVRAMLPRIEAAA